MAKPTLTVSATQERARATQERATLHVHPEGEPGDGKTPAGPEVVFNAEVPSVGDYRLFLDFQHEDVVRTAELTVHAGESDH